MRDRPRYSETEWVPPGACPSAGGLARLSTDLSRAIPRVENALARRSIGSLMRALVSVRAALRSRVSHRHASGYSEAVVFRASRWRRRYAAALRAVDRLLEMGWATRDFEAMEPAVREELAKLRRLESLENEALLDQYWTDLGVGD